MLAQLHSPNQVAQVGDFFAQVGDLYQACWEISGYYVMLILFFKTVPELTLPALETCDC